MRLASDQSNGIARYKDEMLGAVRKKALPIFALASLIFAITGLLALSLLVVAGLSAIWSLVTAGLGRGRIRNPSRDTKPSQSGLPEPTILHRRRSC